MNKKGVWVIYDIQNQNRSVLNFEGTTLCDFALSAGGLGEYVFAVVAGNDWLGVTEYNVGLVAASAFYIHEIGVGSWDQSFQLVGLSFVLVGWVKQISVHLWNLINY